MDEPDLEVELLLVRIKSVQYESSLLKELVKLQRMRIAHLEAKLQVEKKIRMKRWNLEDIGVCRNCGLDAPGGQVFCSRDCYTEFVRKP